MSEVAETKKVGFYEANRVRIAGLVGSGLMLVSSVSAADVDINATIGPILDQVVTLIPSILNLVLSIVPLILTMAVVGFLVAFFDRILGMIKL